MREAVARRKAMEPRKTMTLAEMSSTLALAMVTTTQAVTVQAAMALTSAPPDSTEGDYMLMLKREPPPPTPPDVPRSPEATGGGMRPTLGSTAPPRPVQERQLASEAVSPPPRNLPPVPPRRTASTTGLYSSVKREHPKPRYV